MKMHELDNCCNSNIRQYLRMQYNKELLNRSAWVISAIQNLTQTINSSVKKLLQAEDWLVEGERDRSTTLLITGKEKREKSR